MNKKGFTPILIVLLIAAVLVGYLIYSGKINLPQKQIIETPKSSTNPAPTGAGETANWKIYQGEGFTFKYPESWKLDSYNLITSRPTNKQSSGDYTSGMGWLNINYSQGSIDFEVNTTNGIEKKEAFLINGHKAYKLIGFSVVA